VILNPNCSEEVFRIHGDLETIKREILKMIDAILEDYDRTPKEISNMKNRIKNLKSLDELKEISFQFTCNYPTYFKPNSELDYVDVATCNNHDWLNIDKEDIPGDPNSLYHEISNTAYYDIVKSTREYIVLKKESFSDEKVSYLVLEPVSGKFPPELIKLSYIDVRDIGDVYYLYYSDSHIKCKIANKKILDKLMVNYILPRMV